jgi:hypothetical protein
MSRIFFEELVKAIPRVPGYEGAYRIHVIDLVNNRPADVPPGGFPPYVCPSPSVTAGAAYAITGEVGEDKDYPGEYWVRIYLWQMDKGRLIVSDMVNASSRESCAASYPYILAYLFSTVDETKLATAPGKKPAGDSENHWLSLGFRVGGGNAAWDIPFPSDIPEYNPEDDPDYDPDDDEYVPPPPEPPLIITKRFLNLSGALQIGINITPKFSIQTEVNFNVFSGQGYKWTQTAMLDDDGEPAYDEDTEEPIYENGVVESDLTYIQLTVPLLFKFHLRNDPVKASIYLGPYISLPLVLADPCPYDPYEQLGLLDMIGVIAGVSAGWKLGPGYLFVDARLSHLLHFADDGLKHPFDGATISIGYELGLFKKK